MQIQISQLFKIAPAKERNLAESMIETVRIVFQKQKIAVKTRPAQPFSCMISSQTYRSYASRMAEKHLAEF